MPALNQPGNAGTGQTGCNQPGRAPHSDDHNNSSGFQPAYITG